MLLNLHAYVGSQCDRPIYFLRFNPTPDMKGISKRTL
jgi:hypothetical protein